MRRRWWVAILAAALLPAGCGAAVRSPPPPAAASPRPGSLVVLASGSSYGASIYQEAGNLLRRQAITFNYQLRGLTIGASRVSDRGPAVVASVSSTPLRDLPRVGDSAEVYVPVAFGAVAVIDNVPGVRQPLRLRGRVLADIFLGRVTNWNDRAIAATNRHVMLPKLPITVIHRADPATATDLLTRYLAASSRRWRRGPGAGATIGWPTGFAENDDAAVLQTLAQTPGAIGYTDQDTALQNRLAVAKLLSPSGDWVAPSLGAVAAVGRQSHRDGGLSLRTINADVRGAYPAVAEAYMLTVADPCQAGFSHPQASGVRRLLDYMLGDGQAVVRRFSFAPLPPALLAGARSAVARLRCGGQSI